MNTNKKITRQRINNDPAFERTRENLAEFSNAGKAVKLIRSAFRELIIVAGDAKNTARLQKTAMRIVHTDPASDRGQRTVAKGDISILRDFNFNARNSLSETLFVRPSVQIDRTSGAITVNIPEFVPKVRVQAPPGTTNFQLVAAAAAIDFEKGTHEHAMGETALLSWNKDVTNALTLSLQLPPGSSLPIVVALGVNFVQAVNNKNYLLNSSNFNAAAIVQVDVPKSPPGSTA